MAQPLDGAVVEVELADAEPGRGRQRLADDLDLVVLGRDLDEPEVDVLDRVVRAVMAEPEPARLGAGGPPDDLVAEADAQQRPAVVDDRAGERDLGLEARRIARVRATGSRRRRRSTSTSRRGRRVREDADARAAMAHRPDDVRLQAEVDDADERAALGRRRRTR